MPNNTRTLYSAMISATLLVSSCGGGAGGGAGNTTNQPTPEPSAPPAAPRAEFSEVTILSGIDYQIGYAVPELDPLSALVEQFAGGVASGDYDNDGLIDLFIVRGDIGPNLLYRNLGNNTFTDMATAAGVAFTKSTTENYRHSGPTFADIDGDGELDLFIGGIYNDPSLIYRNNGDGTFTDITTGSGIDTLDAVHTISSAFGDYDLDGDLDLFVSHWGTPRNLSDPGDTEHLWRNDSDGKNIRFTSVSVVSNISATAIRPEPFLSAYGPGHDYSFSPIFARINEDRYPDIVVASDFNTSRVFINPNPQLDYRQRFKGL